MSMQDDSAYLVGIVIGVFLLCLIIPFLAPLWIIGGIVAACRRY